MVLILVVASISGLFYYNSLIQEKKVSYQRTQINDLDLIDDLAQNKDKYFNTFLDDEWLYMIAQIERLTKGQLETFVSMGDLMNSQNAVYTKNLPYQLAKQSKDAISKHNQSNKPRNEQPDPAIIPNKTYWELTKLKVHHDTYMIQHLLEPKNTLIGAKIADISNNLSCLVIGKFANVLAAGFFDGRICIYELSENFLVFEESKVELHAKKQSNAKLIANSSFDLCMHEGPVMSIDLMYNEQYMLSVSTNQQSDSPVLNQDNHFFHLEDTCRQFGILNLRLVGIGLLVLHLMELPQCGQRIKIIHPSNLHVLSYTPHFFVLIRNVKYLVGDIQRTSVVDRTLIGRFIKLEYVRILSGLRRGVQGFSRESGRTGV